MLKKILVIAAIVLNCDVAFAGPFGLEQGMTLKQLSKITKLERINNAYTYRTNKVPKPYNDIESYQLYVSPTDGLCGIRAVSKKINTGAYGEDVLHKFSKVEAALISKYGANESTNELKEGSIWRASNEWMMSLLQKERELSAYWYIPEEEEDEYELIDNLYKIKLQAYALSPSRAYYDVYYYFSNANKCFETFKKLDNSGL
ncbi:MAG: hypothetical protein WC007_11105 [Pelobacteraceae bacterium]